VFHLQEVTSRVGIRFFGNDNPAHMEVHDFQRKNANCQNSEILQAGHAVGFRPDTIAQAHSEHYHNCS
jgi:hypothetical protein